MDNKMVIFTFCLNTETKEWKCAGNISIQGASQIIQQLIVAEAVQKSLEQYEKIKSEKDKPKKKGLDK